ncbi:LADA_0H03114g1_1 [Lachancea dasiensis]|uniref:LADA_0H03114g1_1 n=1 Tax=Lachancea dasiensis TaxID=1072105 RepID=A0A1G4K084_9SACH|nr:LADA_0H03114g1_1 [Lachancea dasiensis]
MSRFDVDVERAVRKACSYEETAPKRKHVRACIVYTWDHKSSKAVFSILKTLPLGQDEITVFKALITIHKIIQEGHGSAIIEGIKNREWIASLGRIYPENGTGSYGRIIEGYVEVLLKKLDFHRIHSGFNGTFEYEEYMSLVSTSDPDQGYETVLDLMDLQDVIDRFGRLLFSSISSGRRNECKISALVPLVGESYGIYKFVMSMIRAIYRQVGEEGAVEPLYARYCEQHSRLFEFYADCSAIKYLTSLLRIPKLPGDPPSLEVGDEYVEGKPSNTRSSSKVNLEVTGTGNESRGNYSNPNLGNASTASLGNGMATGYATGSTPVQFGQMAPSFTGVHSQLALERQRLEELQRQEQLIGLQQEQQLRHQEEQMRLIEQERQREMQLQVQQQQLEAERQQQMLKQQQEQAAFEENMRQQQHSQYLQMAQNDQFQNDLNALREQHERDQSMLQQYDQRVGALERELEDMNLKSNGQVNNLEDQVKSLGEWKEKYSGLARLYAQLRQEHLAVLKKLKKSQQVESSAKEAMLKLDEIELRQKDRSKELQNILKERDRLNSENDRLKSENDRSKFEIVQSLLDAAGNAVMEKVASSECATNLANSYNDLVLDGFSGDLKDVISWICAFSGAMSGALDGQEFLYALRDVVGAPEQVIDKVIDLNIALQTKLSPIQKLVNLPQNDAVKAIINLIKASTACQAEIATTQNPDPYLQHNRWTRGLVSAAEEVAKSTERMVSSTNYETFTAASNQVLASTAQLVAACRVRNPPSQPRLEQYSRIVKAAVKAMRQEPPEYTLPDSELDLQAHIVQLEGALEQSRKKLGEMRYEPRSPISKPNSDLNRS